MEESASEQLGPRVKKAGRASLAQVYDRGRQRGEQKLGSKLRQALESVHEVLFLNFCVIAAPATANLQSQVANRQEAVRRVEQPAALALVLGQ